jgi:hypothetical protein
VRGICCYVAGVMIDFHGFEYEIRNYKLNDNTTAFIFYKETQCFSILNSDILYYLLTTLSAEVFKCHGSHLCFVVYFNVLSLKELCKIFVITRSSTSIMKLNII